MHFCAAALLFLLFSLGAAVPVTADGETILREADAQLSGDRYYNKSEIRTYKNGIAGIAMTFETYSMQVDGELRTLSVYTAPAIMKGNAYLVAGGILWARFGLTKRVREMSVDTMSDSADGTDFGYDDLGETSGGLSGLYNSRIIDERVKIEGQRCTEIELMPKDAKKTPYEKVVAYIADNSPRYIRVDYYRNGALLKHLIFDEYKTVGRREYPFTYTMYSDIRNSRTEVRTLEVEFGSSKVAPDMFTVEYLDALP